MNDNNLTSRFRKNSVNILIALTILGIGSASYFYYQYNALAKNPNKIAEQEVKSLVAMVGKLIVLPTDEAPTVATVADPEKLKDQPFFANAKKGHKVLIYTNARKAILYDPNANKIVEVAPINIGNTAPTNP